MDVITFGEAMIRLAPGNFRRFEQARSLDVEIGGAELNTAVALSRLGRSASWVSRLTDNPLGRMVINRAREAGVYTDHVYLTDEDRVGLYFLEFGAAPRSSRIVYDRADSAMARVAPGMIDWPGILTGSSVFYLSGITAAISESAAQTALEALHAAKSLGVTTCLDPNYRSKLWSVEEAKAWLHAAIPYVDVLVSNPEDLSRFFDVGGNSLDAACAEAVERLDLVALAVTLRESPSVWRNVVSGAAYGGGRFVQSRAHEVEIVDRLGSGDAFVAGFLHGLLEADLQKAIELGTALGALKHTIPGDFAWIEPEEIDALLRGEGFRINR